MELLSRLVMGIVRAVLTLLILLDEVARPLYRPLADWLASLRIVARMESAIARLPRLAILVLLAIPFAIAEPLKIVGALMLARGQALSGLVVLALSYLASFLIVERIYHAGRDKLLTYAWLAWTMTLLVRLRTRLLDWVKSSAAWRAAIRLRDEIGQWWRGQRLR